MSKIDMDSVNKQVFELACKVHGLEVGDTRALGTYEMIKQFLVHNDFMIDPDPTEEGSE